MPLVPPGTGRLGQLAAEAVLRGGFGRLEGPPKLRVSFWYQTEGGWIDLQVEGRCPLGAVA